MKWASGSEKGERISALRRLFGAMRNGVRLLGKKWYMWVSALACLFLIVGSTTVVLCHRLLPGFSSTRLGSALPMREVNAFKREPVITEALRCGWAEGDGKNVSFWSSDGIVFTSDDWGSSWTRRGDASRPAGAFLSARFRKGSYGTATALSFVQYAGRGWANAVNIEMKVSSPLLDVDFPEGVKTGFAVGNEGKIVATLDGGKTWTPQASNVTEDLRSVWFSDAEHGFVAGTPERILKTDNGGKTWNPVYTGNREGFSRIMCSDQGHGWAIGANGIIVDTEDGGTAWAVQRPPLEEEGTLNDIFFSETGRGCAVGDRGVILTKSKGQKEWSRVESGTGLRLETVFCEGNGVWWAGGDGGVLLHSTDDGVTWKRITRPPVEAAAFSGSRGVMAGADGTVFVSNDEGRTWEKRDSGCRDTIWSVCFSETGLAWAVGNHSAILGSKDSGNTWSAAKVDGAFALERVGCTRDGKRAWAFGHGLEAGEVLAYEEQRGSWRREKIPAFPAELYPRAIYFASDKLGWIASTSDCILRTEDGGVNWSLQKEPEGPQRSVAEPPKEKKPPEDKKLLDKKGSRVFQDVILPDSPESARNWLRESSLPGMAGAGPVLYASWDSESRLMFAGLAGSEHSYTPIQLAAERDKAATPKQTPATPEKPEKPEKPNKTTQQAPEVQQTGAVPSGKGTGQDLKQPSDSRLEDWLKPGGGVEEMAAYAKPPFSIDAIAFDEVGKKGWALSYDGLTMISEDGGVTWSLKYKSAPEGVVDVACGKAGQAWMVDEEGSVLEWQSSVDSWKPLSKLGEKPVGLGFDAGGNGRVVMPNGNVLSTTDGGKSWASANPYSIPLPLWYLGALGLAGLLALVPGCRVAYVFLRKIAQIDTKEGAETDGKSTGGSLLVTDNPVGRLKDDRLDFGPFVENLCSFLINENTQPPLVLAVMGKWGSGKSSIMRMLQRELSERGYPRSAWFNAWHSDDETRMLTDILECIRQQAIAPITSLSGILFRARLVVRRFWDSPARGVVFGAVVMLAAMAVYLRQSAVLHKLTVGLLELLYVLSRKGEFEKAPLSLAEWVAMEAPRYAEGCAFAFLTLSALVVAAALLKWSQLYDVNPFHQLLSSLSGWFRTKDLDTRSSFRQRFSKTIGQVTWALGRQQRLTLFIDDLDRCPAKEVRQVLEAVNYLVSSCNCYVILGMDWSRVRDCIASELKIDGCGNGSGNELPDRYMHKIVTLRVDAPKRGGTALRNLVGSGTRSSTIKRWERSKRVLRIFRAACNHLTVPTLLAVLLYMWLPQRVCEPCLDIAVWKEAAGIPLSSILSKEAPAASVQASPPLETGGAQSGGEAPSPAAPEKPVEGGQTGGTPPVPASPSFEPEPVSQERASLSIGLSLVISFVVLFVLLAPLLLGPDARSFISGVEVVRDSKAFVASLQLWCGMVALTDSTPRTNKRFQNKARFRSMVYGGKESVRNNAIVAVTALEESSSESWKEFASSRDIEHAAETFLKKAEANIMGNAEFDGKADVLKVLRSQRAYILQFASQICDPESGAF